MTPSSGIGRDADARGHEHLVPVDADRLLEVRQDSARHRARRESIARIGQQNDELVAAEPRQHGVADRLDA